MSLEIEGTVNKILSEQTGDGRNGKWIKQDFVIETNEKFPKKICFTAWGDKVDIVKNMKIGDSVKVGFNAESREFKEKWYTELRAWKIDSGKSGVNPSGQEFPKFPDDDIPPPEEEDLPF